jgi:hypothetical protein
MDNYKVLADASTLGPQGSIVTADEIIAAPADIDQLVASGIVELTTNKKADKE